MRLTLTLCFQTGTETIVEEYLLRKYEGLVVRITREKKEDLKLVSPSSSPIILISVSDLS